MHQTNKNAGGTNLSLDLSNLICYLPHPIEYKVEEKEMIEEVDDWDLRAVEFKVEKKAMREEVDDFESWDLPKTKLSKDLKESARTMSRAEARYIVDLYYMIQKHRIRNSNQVFSLSKSEEPHALIDWSFGTFKAIEANIKLAMNYYVTASVPGRWLKSIHGIGPILAAGLLAHIDIEKAPTTGHIWRFGGLDPTVVWKKGEKRPWNADLKTLFWKCGESFCKLRNSPNDIYGKIYEERKAQEVGKNEALDFKELAIASLKLKKFGDNDTKKCYEAGKLPPGRIDLRAKRYAVKRFLSDLHAIMYFDRYKTIPPKPWVITHGGHAHYIVPPIDPKLKELAPLKKMLKLLEKNP